jgi:murein DD-endopeptidase MepM/ murein hydrolase activator NlpD
MLSSPGAGARLTTDAAEKPTAESPAAPPAAEKPAIPKPVVAAPPIVVPTVPSRWPLAIPGYVTRGTLGEGPYSEPHPGVDVAVPEGTEIRAAGAGSIVEVGESAEYGKFLRLAHADGYETVYAHASRVLVAKGQTVAAGTAIALSGNTGRSTAPHLHFEVRRAGAAVDPMQLIKQGQ